MDNRPPPKKKMKFTIDNILGLGSIFSITNLLNLQSGSGSSKEPKDYVDRLETTIEHNRKARNENTVEAILNRFLLVAQSFKQKDVSLWGQPFNVMATVVDKSALPKQQQLPGSGRNKKIAAVRHRINNRSLIQACLPSFNNKNLLK
uniref:Uncharacterized protein n=1 Tax=Meloidogyne floridensis TaxID=298350 RepID=A0A915NSU1_9BILA